MTDNLEPLTREIEIVGQADWLWKYQSGTLTVPNAPPAFEIDGHAVIMAAKLAPLGEPVIRGNGVTEHQWRGPIHGSGDLELELIARITPAQRKILQPVQPSRPTRSGQ